MFRRLHASDYSQYYRLINEFRSTEFTETQFINTLDKIQQSSEIWVLEQDGRLLATGTIIFEHKFIFDMCIYAHIEDVCVSKEHRRMGLGKQIVNHLLQQVKHCYKVTLDCSDENVPFYLACGLEKRGNQMCQLVSNLPTLYLTPKISARNSPYLSEKNTGLGNVMFQIASTYGLAKKTGRIPIWNNVLEFADTLKSRYGFNHKDAIFRNFLESKIFLFETKQIHDGYGKYEEGLVNYLEESHKNIMIEGYLENTRYFNEYKDEICALFSPDIETLEKIKTLYPVLFDEQYTTVGIHFRGNEYLRLEERPNFEELKRYIKLIKAKISNPIFLVFSDDIDAFDFTTLKDDTYMKMGNNEDYIDLWSLSLCKHAVLSHSTFSFWAAYLNQNKDAMFCVGYGITRPFHSSLNMI